MKTVMKKLLSVMLVALLLVSAVPFAAFADGGYGYTLVADGYSFNLTDADGKVTEAELYAALELSKGDDAGIDAWMATKTFPIDVTSGNVVLTVTASSGGSNSGSGTGTGTGSGSGSGSGSSTGGNGEAKPEVTPAGTFSLTIDYKLEGYAVKTVKATEGKLYKDYVGVPARNGYTFLGWASAAKNGEYIDIEKDAIKADDTITAKWIVNEYYLTFDENRGAEETVSTGKRVTFDQPIGSLPTPSKRDGYVFVGWKINGEIISADTIYVWPGDNTAYAEWKLESDTSGEAMNPGHTADGKVYLEIYTNDNTDKYVKKVEITSYAADNKITRAEVETVVKKYVTAKAGYSLAYEGLFDEETWWWYVRDPETNGKDSIVVNKDGDDYVYVMVNNVKTVANKPADSTNPQTGDAIGLAVALMMSTGGAALTLAKKKFF